MELRRHSPDDPDLPLVLSLIRDAFACMDGLVDPPSSVHRLSLRTLREQAAKGEVWSIGPPVSACAVFTPITNTLHIGKLCVAVDARGTGLSRRLIDHAAKRARALSLRRLELQSRIELTGNHAAFAAMGFLEIGRTAHPGFARPTSITFAREL